MQRSQIIELYKEDRAERTSPDFFDNLEKVGRNDKRRRGMLRKLLKENNDLSAEECYAAAMIFHHGEKRTHFKNAVRFARKAMSLGHKDAGRLYAMTIDRMLMDDRLPQKYGTQFHRKDLKSKWSLWKVDPAITDAERKELGVPSLEEAKKEVEQLNVMRVGMK